VPTGGLSRAFAAKALRLLPNRAAAILSMLVTRPTVALLDGYGYSRSLRLRLPVDADNSPLPWLPYCVVTLLAERIGGDLRLLEFGAGYSTLFFMSRVMSVTSIEHDPEWANELRHRALAHVNIVTADSVSPDGYCAHVKASPERYDLILVDGIHRNECFQLALDRLTPRGVVILDDSARAEYGGLAKLAASKGLNALRLQGHKAASAGLHWTTIFYRAENCLRL
jgi:hypothetical protein